MFYNLYIIKPNGICIFHKRYGSLDEDPQIVSNFLTAVSIFSKELFGNPTRIIMTESYKFTFKWNGSLSFAILSDTTESDQKIQVLLETVEMRFQQCFPEHEAQLMSGNLKHFKKFSQPLATIMKDFV